MHQNGHLKSLYPRALSVQAYKRQNCSSDWPKVANSGSLGLSNLAVQGTHFELTVWILPVKSRAENFSPVKTRLPSSTPINRSGCHVWREKKIECKVDKNQPFSPIFIFFCFLLLNHTFGHHHSHHRLSHYNLHHIQTLNILTWWLHHFSLSLSLSSLRNSFPSHHRDPSCSSNHPFQRLPPLPATAEATILSSSTPTVSNPSTDHDSSSTSNASSSNFGSSTLHRCHRLHHVVLLGQTTLTPGNFPLPIPLPLLLLLLHYCALRE